MSPLLAHLSDASVRALLLALIAWSALRIAGVRRTAVQHAVWTLALAGMLLLPALSFSGMPRMALHVLKSAPPPAPLAHPVSVVKPPPASPMVKTAPAARPAKRKEPVDWTTRGYIAVAGFLLLRLIAGACLARKLVRRSRRVNDPRFRESDAVKVPITSGLLRPVVLLPCCWRDWPPWKLNAVVEHELSHVRRGDLLVAFCAALNRSIFWFHPLAWWLERRLAALAEQASDDCSIAATADRARYAQALLEVAASLGPRGRRIAWQGAAMSRCSAVSRRIDRILDLRESLGGILSRRGWLALIACAAPDQLRSRGFEILGVDDDEEIGKAKQIVAKAGVTWLQADARKLIQKRFRVMMYPSTVLVDPQGKIISIGDGDSLRGENLIPTLERLLPRQ